MKRSFERKFRHKSNLGRRVIFLLMFFFPMSFIFSQTKDTTIYLGGNDNVPHPKKGFKEIYMNIRQALPDSTNYVNIIELPLYSIKVVYPGYVDSVLTIRSSGNYDLDEYIKLGFKKTKFIYLDSLSDYPKIKWITLPVNTKEFFNKKKSIWEILKFW